MTTAPGISNSSAVASTAAWSAAWFIGLSADASFVVPSRPATLCSRSCSLGDDSFCWAKLETLRPMANPMASPAWSFMIYFWEELSSVFYHSGENSRTQSSPKAVLCRSFSYCLEILAIKPVLSEHLHRSCKSGLHRSDIDECLSIYGCCLCSSLRYEAAGQPDNVTHGHCSDCPESSGAA